MLETISDWTSALNNKDNIDCIFIDFKKAFDSISHSKLLHKLNSYGLPLLVTKWIKSFLTGRTQQVKIGNSDTLSSSLPCTSGIPQGSVLGPILFILFINDLTNVCKFSKLMLYADDVTLYATVNNIIDANRLQADLDSIALWSQEWQLPINIKKCLFMRIRSASKLDFVYTIGGVNLQLVEHARLLGIILSQNMSVTNQCDNVASQGLKRVFLLLNSFCSSNTSTMISLYKTYVRPILEYCTPAWSPYLLQDIDQLESVQRFFTRSLPGIAQLPYHMRLTTLGLQSLELRRIHRDCLYLYKMLHNIVDSKFNDMFTFRSDLSLSNMPLRGNCLTFCIPKFHLACYEHNFAVCVVHYWNALPDFIVQSISLNSLYNHLINFDFSRFLKGKAINRP